MSEESPTYYTNPPITKRKSKKDTPTFTKVSQEPIVLSQSKNPVMTFEAWASDPVVRRELSAALSLPIIQMAIETLKRSYEADIQPIISSSGSFNTIPSAVDLNNLLALRSTHRSGFLGAFNALENLTKEKALRRSNSNPWGDFVPDNK